ncbi:MAG: PEP-CTERM sorting domain-containing protein [Nitrosomonas sp.]|nr:PEP-CTERM sorting domain-containing protein [Nitrosomonas sp.]OQW84203.1 MAG: hypothetical protein BVN30_04210 [Proteobacteria bacterium ST_bin16]
MNNNCSKLKRITIFLVGISAVSFPFTSSAGWSIIGLDRAIAYPNDINNSGQVVGNADTNDDGYAHAFITGANGVGMTDLGTLGGNQSGATGINDSGQVVGWALTNNGSNHAFLFSGGVMTDLSLLAPVVADGWTELHAQAINDNEQIVGWGWHNGTEQAFLLSFGTSLPIPEPETYIMLLTGLGLLGFMVRRRK